MKSLLLLLLFVAHAHAAEPSMEQRTVQRPTTVQDWCDQALKLLANPAGSQYLKAALLEKMRNRGCLR